MPRKAISLRANEIQEDLSVARRYQTFDSWDRGQRRRASRRGIITDPCYWVTSAILFICTIYHISTWI